MPLKAGCHKIQDGVADFEKKYGEGSAVAVLEGTYQPPVTEDPEGPSMLDQAMGFASNVASACDLTLDEVLDGTYIHRALVVVSLVPLLSLLKR